MKLVRLYRASMYVMLFLATMVLSVNAQDYNRLAMLYPLGVAAAGVAAFLTVDRNPKQGLARDLANFLAMGSFVIASMEYWSNADALALALGHWLVYLQLLKMFLPKTDVDDWFLFLLGLFQVVIGVYLSQSHEVGILLIAWALTSLWTLGLFHLHREASRLRPAAGVVVIPAPDVRNPYPGLLNAGFFLSAASVALTSLALGVVTFLVMPRWSTAATMRGAQPGTKHLTGFSDEVQLGRMGEILENDGVVMSVETYDASDTKIRPPEDVLWRGVTLVAYEDGRWVREAQLPLQIDRAPIGPTPPGVAVTQRIKLEATEGDVLFAIRPLSAVAGRRGDEIAMNRLDGTVYRLGQRIGGDYEQPATQSAGVYDYQIRGVLDARGRLPQAREILPRGEHLRMLRYVRRDLEERLRAIGDRVLEGDAEAGPEARALKLQAYLRDSGGFFYTLSMTRADPTLDPVLDFLENRREGHCEYFASALTLLLRAQGIPARMVNGFKGGDWNELFGVMTVRQKHAHSWVEALVGRDASDRPIWLTLDPTPARQREQVVAQVGGVSARFRTVTDSLRQFWVFNVTGFDQERQNRLIYGPARQLAAEAARGFGMIYGALRRALGWLFYFESTQEFFSWRGFLVSVVAMLLAVGAAGALRWGLGKVARRIGKSQVGGGRGAHGIGFYHRLVRLLGEAGLERPASETPREFARRASVFLMGRPAGADRLAAVPSSVVEAFYHVRFGHHALDAEALRELDAKLDALESGLRPSRS